MPKTGFYFVLESESDVTSSSGEDTESVLSIQNKSTDIAKDTSDTSSKSSSSGSDYDSLAGLEYEVMSLPEQEHEHPFDSYSSGADSLKTFLMQLHHYKVGFSAYGFFQINNQILTSIIGSVTTFLAIMIQFNSTEPSAPPTSLHPQ